ncbi:MAG: hypothetical protein V4543_14985 [Bacteroidota bacterium]
MHKFEHLPDYWSRDEELLNSVPDNLPVEVEDIVYRKNLSFMEDDPIWDIVVVIPDSSDLKMSDWALLHKFRNKLMDIIFPRDWDRFPMVSFKSISEAKKEYGFS